MRRAPQGSALAAIRSSSAYAPATAVTFHVRSQKPWPPDADFGRLTHRPFATDIRRGVPRAGEPTAVA